MLAKQGRLKRYRQRVKQYRQNRISKTTKENSINNWEGVTRKHTNNRMQKKPNDFGQKYGNQKKYNENAEWINNITRELEGLEEAPKTEINIDLHKTTLKRISNWKAPGHDGIHGFWFKKFAYIHGRLTLERRSSTWMDDKRKDYINPNGPKQRNWSKQLQTDNLPTNDVENTNSTNKGKDLILANKPRIVPWRTERMPQRIQRHSGITLHRSTHPKWEQDKTENSIYGLDWQKGIWYGPTKLDNTLSQNVQNITWSLKLHRTDHANLESGADSRRKRLSWNKDPKRDFPKRCTITLTIHNSHDATEPHSQKMRSQIQTQQIAREDQSPNVHGWH